MNRREMLHILGSTQAGLVAWRCYASPRSYAGPMVDPPLGGPAPPSGQADGKAGSRVRKLSGHTDILLGLAISPDGSQIAAGGNDKTLRIWEVTTGRQVHFALDQPASVRAVAFSRDGSRVVCAGPARWEIRVIVAGQSADGTIRSTHRPGTWSGGAIQIRDSVRGSVIQSLQPTDVPAQAVALSPDAARVVSVSRDFVVDVRDVQSGRTRCSMDALRTRSQGTPGYGPASCSVSFSADADRVVAIVTPRPDGLPLAEVGSVIGAWEIKSGKTRKLINLETAIYGSIAISHDGSRVVAGGGRHFLTLWEFESGRTIRHFRGNTERGVGFLAFSPDGTTIVTGDSDGVLRMFDGKKGTTKRVIQGPKGPIRAVAFVGGGLRVVSGGSRDLSERDPETRRLIPEPLTVWDVDDHG